MGLPMYRLEQNKNVKLIIDGKLVYVVVIRYNDIIGGHGLSILWCKLFIYGQLHIYTQRQNGDGRFKNLNPNKRIMILNHNLQSKSDQSRKGPHYHQNNPPQWFILAFSQRLCLFVLCVLGPQTGPIFLSSGPSSPTHPLILPPNLDWSWINF